MQRAIATIGAALTTLAIYSGSKPGPLLAASGYGTSPTTIVVFVGLVAGGLWVLRSVGGAVWRWAVPVGIVLATASLAGISLVWNNSLTLFTSRSGVGPWAVVHWVGIAWLASAGVAALLHAIDRYTALRMRSRDESTPEPAAVRNGRFARLARSLDSGERRIRRKGLLVVMGLLVLSRIPYLIIWWPGILFFDTFRSYAYARGTSPWEAYEPVGHSLLITAEQWLGTTLGLGDAGGVAIAAIVQIIATSAAFTFMLARLAAWGIRNRIWVCALAWAALLPVFGLFSIGVDKDVPFSAAFLIFAVCVAEVAFGPHRSSRWPWVTMAISGFFVIVMRNNGVYIAVLAVLLLFLFLRRAWKPILGVLAACLVGYAIYVGPIYAALDVRPAPAGQEFSVALQQLARITKDHQADLTPKDIEFLTRTFSGMPPSEMVKHYNPYLSDPMKLLAQTTWDQHSLRSFVSGWARLAGRYPGSALEAWLANTVGYWGGPEAPSFDGLTWWSANDVRHIHLGIPSGKPTTGVSGWIAQSGFIPTTAYSRGQLDNGYRAVPVLSALMSPGLIWWAWGVATIVVLRQRRRAAFAAFLPAATLVLTLLDSPVSGGARYSLPLFMALPVAVAAGLVAGSAVESKTQQQDGSASAPARGKGLRTSLAILPARLRRKSA